MQRRDELGRTEVRFRIRSWPLEIVNAKPVDDVFIGEEIDEIGPQVAPELFSGFDAEQFPASSLPALGLAIAAYQVDAETGEAMSMALRRALFEQGRNIGDPTVLAELAAEHRVSDRSPETGTDAVIGDYEQGKQLGVVGSPHFMFGDQSAFCPVLSIARVDGHLQVSFDEAAAEQMLSSIFA